MLTSVTLGSLSCTQLQCIQTQEEGFVSDQASNTAMQAHVHAHVLSLHSTGRTTAAGPKNGAAAQPSGAHTHCTHMMKSMSQLPWKADTVELVKELSRPVARADSILACCAGGAGSSHR